MSQNSIPRNLQLFLADLVAIRENNGVTLDDIRANTKVYPHIIAQFEEDGLNGHPLFNVLYLKAFVRSYAKVLGISQELSVKAYEAALEGHYKRELAIEYLNVDIESIDEGNEDVLEESSEAAIESIRKVRHSDASAVRRSIESAGISKKESQPARIKIRNRSTAANSWFERTVEQAKDQGLAFIQMSKEQGFVQWIAMGAGICVIAFVVIQLVSLSNREIPPGLSQSTTSAIQEASVNEQESGQAVPAPVDSQILAMNAGITAILERINQGDTINVTVIAAGGKLDPFRVKVDNDLRRPYWLDTGDSMLFRVGDQVMIEDNLQSMEILLEEWNYPIRSVDSTARVVINRDSAQSFLKSTLQ